MPHVRLIPYTGGTFGVHVGTFTTKHEAEKFKCRVETMIERSVRVAREPQEVSTLPSVKITREPQEVREITSTITRIKSKPEKIKATIKRAPATSESDATTTEETR